MSNEEMGDRVPPEHPDVDHRRILVAVAGFFALVFISMAALFMLVEHRVPSAFRVPVERLFAEPRLQVVPRADLINLERQQRDATADYGWVDRTKGIAHIPIDEAMRLVEQRGARAYDPPASDGSEP